ncbi:hypothetical protein TrRE_jg12905, partial [Triparma retinervis]
MEFVLPPFVAQRGLRQAEGLITSALKAYLDKEGVKCSTLPSRLQSFIYTIAQPTIIASGVQGSEAAFFATAMSARDAIACNVGGEIDGMGEDQAMIVANEIVEKALKNRDSE